MSSARRRAYSRYRHDAVETASPQQLILLLYQRAVTALEFGIKSPAEGRQELVRAQAIVGELQAALDENASPELVERLESLYAFAQHRIRVALEDSSKVEGLAEARDVLVTLLEGWRGAFAA
jgi:flagellar secretion chaperone FliS